MKKPLLAALALFILSGCTSMNVTPIPDSEGLTHVDIQENPAVLVADFLPALQEGLARHGISSKTHSGSPPEDCEFVLNYSAWRGWDLGLYLKKAEVRLRRSGKLIGSIDYYQGGMSFLKWRSTRTKMDPLFDELLNEYGQ